MKNRHSIGVGIMGPHNFKVKETLILEKDLIPYEELLKNYYSDMSSGKISPPDELELALFFEDLFDLISLDCENTTIH